ncbi:MAG: hypothetical protein ACK5UY_00035 [Holosporales bacterium]
MMLTPHDMLNAAGLVCAGGSLYANAKYYLALGKQNHKKNPSKVFAAACGVSFLVMGLNVAHPIDTEVFTAIVLNAQLVRTATAISIERDKDYPIVTFINELFTTYPVSIVPTDDASKTNNRAPLLTSLSPSENTDLVDLGLSESGLIEVPNKKISEENLTKKLAKITRNQQRREFLEFSCIAGAACVSLFQHPELAVAFLLASTGLSLYRLHDNQVPKFGVHVVQKGVRVFIPVVPDLAVVSEMVSYLLLKNRENNNNSKN